MHITYLYIHVSQITCIQNESKLKVHNKSLKFIVKIKNLIFHCCAARWINNFNIRGHTNKRSKVSRLHMITLPCRNVLGYVKGIC